jgi:hypothetical protein
VLETSVDGDYRTRDGDAGSKIGPEPELIATQQVAMDRSNLDCRLASGALNMGAREIVVTGDRRIRS